MYLLKLKHKFDSAHFLRNYSGKCKNMHGHTYFLEVVICSEELASDMVVDFVEVKKILKETVDEKFDHKCINEVVDYNPTAENMSKDIFHMLKERISDLKEITLWEGPNSSVTYYED